MPYHSILSQTTADVSPVSLLLIVKSNVTTLSQPEDVCSTYSYSPLTLYVVPYHSILSQTTADVSPVSLLLIVKSNVTTLSQPEDVCSTYSYSPLVV